MNFLDAAYVILHEAKRPLHYTEISRLALERSLIETAGQTPEATMGSRLYVDSKNDDSRFQREGRGYFALVERGQTDEIRQRVNDINQQTRQRLRELLHEMTAKRFETLIGELLRAIGFEEDSVEVTRYHGDGGIDVRGILNAGGITRINAAVQVKKWRRNIPVTTVRNVRGSLTNQEQGIIITTSNFARGARIEANASGKTPISLVDGDELIELLVKHKIGVNKEQYTVESLDTEWWGELITPITTSANPPQPVAPRIQVTYPVTVQAMNDVSLTAQLLNEQGQMLFNNQHYNSPSGAGKDASGWKSCNGWNYWRYQHPETQEWQAIQDLRPLKD